MECNRIITIDAAGPDYAIVVYAKQLDNIARTITARLTINGAAYVPVEGDTAVFRYTRPDGTHNIAVATIDQTTGYITVALDAQALAVAGAIICDISISNGDSTISTPLFFVNAEKSPTGEVHVVELDEYQALLRSLEQANTLNDQLQQAITDAASAVIADGAVTKAKLGDDVLTVEHGTIGSWNYTKWSDGNLEALASLTLSNVNVSNSSGNGYTNSSAPQSVDISALGFTEVSFCTVSGGTYGGGAWAAARSCDASTLKININSFTALTNANVYVGVLIKGKYQ